jgi:hypothetical protein
MNDLADKKNNRFSDRALIAVFAVISIFLLAVIVFFMTTNPLPLNAAGLGGWLVIMLGFIFLGGLFWPHLEGKVIDDDDKNSAQISRKAKPGRKGITLWKRIAIIIAATIDVLTILFVLAYIIWGLIATL